MTLIPEFEIGLWNGWIPLCLFYLIFGILLISFPKDVVKRLYDRSYWSKKRIVLIIIGKLLAFAYLILIIFTPLKIGFFIFIIGITIYALGLVGFVIALFNYKNTSISQPVTRGLYRISRHPQILTLLILYFGICIAIGSWLILLMFFIFSVFNHFRILAEEKACLELYGDSYHEYKNKTPRYFLFF
jgi:protein-S-isoprenylcysteine O-methyltransferase Ste14